MSFDVKKVAELSYLKISEAEEQEFTRQFDRILEYVDQIQAVPMTEDEAKAMGAFHVQTAFYKQLNLNPTEVLRDETQQNDELNRLKLSNEEALRNSPKSSGLPNELMFEVPSIIER